MLKDQYKSFQEAQKLKKNLRSRRRESLSKRRRMVGNKKKHYIHKLPWSYTLRNQRRGTHYYTASGIRPLD